MLRTLAGRLDVKNADERKRVRPRQAVLQGAEFKELWDRIKHKTTYRVRFDNDGLVAQCARALQDAPQIPRTRLQWRKADIAVGQAGVQATERSGAATVVLDERDIPLPDVLTELQDRTRLTRRSIYRILSDSHRLDDFKRNPQAFIELVAQVINRCKRQAVVDGIKYQRLGDDHYYAQELFENEELTGYLKNMLGATKSVYRRSSTIPTSRPGLRISSKRTPPSRYTPSSPAGSRCRPRSGAYRPDWAVLVATATHLASTINVQDAGFCQDGAAIVVAAVAAACRPDATVESIVQQAVARIPATSGARMLAGVQQAFDAIRGRDYAAFRGYVHEHRDRFFQLRKANSLETVPLTLALFSLADGNVERCVTYAANFGGDTDTMAAMARAIAGAFGGVGAVRPDWLDKVKRNADQDQEDMARGLAAAAVTRLDRERAAGARRLRRCSRE